MTAEPPVRRFGRLGLATVLCLTLGLAPFVPEPHLVGKIRWVAGGGVGMQLIDVFDLVWHGFPFVWWLIEAVRLAIRTPR